MSKIERYARELAEKAERLEVPQSLKARFSRYVSDAVAFVREQLGVEPEPYQVEILGACVTAPRLAWRAAHGIGKTTTLAWVLCWWLLTRPFSRVLVLAPAFERQVGRYLLPEVKKWLRHAPQPLPLAVRATTVEVVGFEREWFALAVQATDPAKVEGGHAESLCVLADEAKGLNAEVVAALHGTQTDPGGDRLYVLASIPGGPSGPFYDVFRSGTGLWRLFRTAAADSRLVSPAWIQERAAEWGEHSPLFVARVQAEFPEESEDTLFRLADLEAAVGRVLEQPADPVCFGLDCARFGDDASALAVWRGHVLEGVTTKQGLDTMAVAAWVASEINRCQPARVVVDEIGIGSGVLDRLRQLGYGNVDGLNVGRPALQPTLYLNRRAEVFFSLRQALERGEVSLPADPGLLAELSSLRFEYTASGQLKLEDKAMTKRRVGHSPDKADAVALAYSAVESGGGHFALIGGRIIDLFEGRVVSHWDEFEERFVAS